MKLSLFSLFVDDQAKALAFYTDVLGFVPVQDIPAGSHRWITVASAEDPAGTQLSLEPNSHPAAKAYQQALFADGIPAGAFEVSDLDAEHGRLKEHGVVFTQEPADMGPVKTAVFADTCGNLIQLYQPAP